MKIKKEDWFKIITIVCLIAVSASICYYYTIFLPSGKYENKKIEQSSKNEKDNSVKKEDVFSKKESCQKYKKQIETDIDKENVTRKNGVNTRASLDGIYYSSVKNTCVYVSVIQDYKDNSLEYEERNIIDALSGDTIKSSVIREVGKSIDYQKLKDFEIYVESITGECYGTC